ncbi:MAG: TnpV protein [Acutalibacteraceae bacterium]|nr:TnpV protein [Acutalibacteraceae bacterium]
MKKHIVNEATGISYTLVGDYYIPDLKLPETENKPIGIWGRKRLAYIKEHKKFLFNQLVLNWKLNSHLAEINEQATEMLDRLTEQMAKAEGVTEELKEGNQMEWVSRMNNIRNRVEEIVNAELIYN